MCQLSCFLCFFIINSTVISKKVRWDIFSIKALYKDEQGRNVYIDPDVKKVIREFTFISIIKLFVEQTSKFVMFSFFSVKAIGDFAFISNLMSLIVNNVFFPVEQFFFNFFSKQNITDRQGLFAPFFIAIKYVLIFTQLCSVYGVYLFKTESVEPVLGEYYGKEEVTWNIKLYFLLLIPMGLNGIIESFLYSTIPKEKVRGLRFYNVVNGV